MPPKKKKKKSPARKTLPKKKESIVEQVFNERNLVIAPVEMVSTAPVVKETMHGKVRIEGEVTPEKLALANQFDAVFQSATEEVMSLAAYIPDERVMGLVKGGGVTQEMVNDMKKAPAWTFFDVGGEKLMKTPDNKLDTVKNYCYRLERAVLDQIKLKNSEVGKAQHANHTLQGRILILEQTEKSLSSNVEKLQKRIDAQAETIRTLKNGNPTFFYRLALEFGPLYDKLKAAFVKLLS